MPSRNGKTLVRSQESGVRSAGADSAVFVFDPDFDFYIDIDKLIIDK